MSKNPTFKAEPRLTQLLSKLSVVTDQEDKDSRLKFLDELDLLKSNPDTKEATMHKALEDNLWVLGPDYSSTLSNNSLTKTVEEYLDRKFIGPRAAIRTDLYLGETNSKQGLLIEFKKPTETLRRDSETMALKYRDDLNSAVHCKEINILIIGGQIGSSVHSTTERADLKFMTYTNLISNARKQLLVN
jgi:hypothetical protein